MRDTYGEHYNFRVNNMKQGMRTENWLHGSVFERVFRDDASEM